MKLPTFLESQNNKAKSLTESLRKKYRDSHISILSLSTLTQIKQRTINRILVQHQEPRVSEYLLLDEALNMIERYRSATGSKLKINVWNYDHFDYWMKRKSTDNLGASL